MKECNAMDWFHLPYIFWGSFVSFDLAEWHFWEVRLRLCPCTNLTECNVNEWSMCDARLWHLFYIYKCYIWPWSGCKYNVSDFDRKTCNYMGSSAQDGENEEYLSYFFFFLELYCGQTVWFFEVSSTVLKRFCPLQSKNTSVLVLAIFLDF